MEKDALPPYEKVDRSPSRWPFRQRRRRALKLLVLALVIYVTYGQWTTQKLISQTNHHSRPSTVSVDRLQADYAVCSKLRRVIQEPSGYRDRNARYIDGHKPTLIRNATVWTGEPSAGSSAEDVKSGKAFSWVNSDVLLEYGLIKKVEPEISEADLPEDTIIWKAEGRQLTAGLVDMHSHTGVGSLPESRGGEDSNEGSGDITPYVRSLDGINPFDPQIQVIKSGGVTTSLILPGSANNMGGEAYVIKHAVGKPDGRSEVAPEDMLVDPSGNLRWMKMACGENPKRVYGKFGRDFGPTSRLGEAWYFRHAFEEATKYVKSQDDWCQAADTVGVENMDSYLPQELKWESLGAALRGQVYINTHCYTVPDLEAFVRHTNEFKFRVRAFHHAHQTYLVPEILKRAWGGRPPAAALFADNMYYKMESYVASEQAGKILYENGITPVYVSDNPVLNAQHVVFEAAKGYRYGLPYHAALAGVTSASAELLGLGERVGRVKSGFDADITVWDSDPLSVGATPVQVWIDGTAQFEDPVVLKKPISSPIKPDLALGETKDRASHAKDVVFTGVSKVLTAENPQVFEDSDLANVVVSDGKVTCIGRCEIELRSASASKTKFTHLRKGHLSPAFVSLGSYIGVEEIAQEEQTSDGANDGESFSRAVDGLALDTKQLQASYAHGVTRAITAPKFRGEGSKGVSVGFLTGAKQSLENHAVWDEEVAVHYSFTESAKHGKTPSLSSAVGALRHALLKAVGSNETISDPYSEEAYLERVVKGNLPIAVHVHSADIIGALIRLKSDVEDAIKAKIDVDGIRNEASKQIRMVVIGAAESWIVAKELAKADIGVVLGPLQPYAASWDQRRSLTGAPLTNDTAIDVLVEAGVLTVIGVNESWEVRNLGLMAGIAFRNGGGKFTETEALALIGKNVGKILGRPKQESDALKEDFLVFEGHPFDIDSTLRAVGDGTGLVTIWA